MSVINITVFVLWIVSALIDAADFCYLWQLKEYRIDRFRDYLHTRQGQSFWWQYHLFWRSLLATALFLLPFNEPLLLKQFLIAIFVADILFAIRRKRKAHLHRPRLTSKAFLIMAISVGIEGLLFLIARDWSMLLLLLIIRFAIVTGVVAAFWYPTVATKRLLIRRAHNKLKKYPNLKVIGITGSYGKSSTKEFLAHILSDQYRVVRTPKNINTEIGVASFILKTDLADIDYAVIEMGAYTIGEISLICDMVQPTYGILTVIAEEHLALFGSMENIQQAKYELLRSLPQHGFGVTNADNAYCTAWISELAAPVETFGLDEESKPTALITEFHKSRDGIAFTLTVQGKPYRLNAPILGEHNALNIAAAVLMARHLGMTMQDIAARIEVLSAEHGIIRTYEYGSCVIIDDTYNSNPTGFRAALSLLSQYPSAKRRIVVTRGMLELGDVSEEKHEGIGGEISFSADELIIITPDNAAAIERGIVKKYGIDVLHIYDPQELLAYLMACKHKDCVVLLENRLLAGVYEALKKDIAVYYEKTKNT